MTSPTTPPPSGAMFWDRQGQPIPFERWVEMWHDLAGRTLARDEVGPFTVITAWLGTDQRPGDEGEPLIFGTAVYRTGSSKFLDDRERHAATEAAALENHRTVVSALGES